MKKHLNEQCITGKVEKGVIKFILESSEDFITTLKHVFYWLCLFFLIALPQRLYTMIRMTGTTPSMFSMVFIVIAFAVSTALFGAYMFIWGGLVHLLFKFFEGKATYLKTVQITGATALINAAGVTIVYYLEQLSDYFIVLMLLIYLFSIVVRLIMLKEAHKLSWTRTIIAYALIYVPILVLTISIFVLLATTIMPPLAPI